MFMKKFKKGAILKNAKKQKGSIFIEHNKITAELETVRISVPEQVKIPLLQHSTVACEPTVNVGQYVKAGQIIGNSSDFSALPVHASVSGTVSAIEDIIDSYGKTVPTVIIRTDGEIKPYEGILPPNVTDKASLITALRNSGLTEFGSVGLPAHAKIDTPDDKKIDTLIVNATESEPYISVSYRECIENSWDIFGGIYALKEILGIKKIFILIENNKPQAIKILKSIADKHIQHGNEIRIITVKAKYPQQAEKTAVFSATGKKVPAGKLPGDVGCLVMNVASVAFISRYLKSGKPLISRTLTVSGDCIKKPLNVRVPIGTSVDDIINFCGGFTKQPYKIISGGPLMGNAIISTDTPVTKCCDAILAFSKEYAQQKPESNCICCSRCHDVCPSQLFPSKIAKAALNEDGITLKRLDISECIECGCCAYVCPANRQLVQYIRFAKEIAAKVGDLQ